MPSSTWWLCFGAVVGFGLGTCPARAALRKLRRAEAQQGMRWQHVHDAVLALSRSDVEAAMVELLTDAVRQATGLRAHWVEASMTPWVQACEQAPFFVEPHLVGMALRRQETVSSAALAPLGWAWAYLPVWVSGRAEGVLVLAMPEGTGQTVCAQDLVCCEILTRHLAVCINVSRASNA